MDELIKMVAGKVGISPEQAEQAVTTVIGFIKGRLPDSLAGQLDGLLSGEGGAAGGALGAVEDALGGLFGKK